MKRKRLIGLLCSGMTIALLLSGCSASSESSESDSPNTSTEKTASEDPNYEDYLDWKTEEYQAASAKKKENAARAYMVYSAQKTGSDITLEEAEQVPDEILPSAMEQMEQFYAQDQDGRTIKQILDDNYDAASNLNLDLDAVELGEYEKFLKYTDQDYASASSDDKKNVLIAYYLAVMGTDINDADVNNLGMDFDTLDSSLQQMFQAMPGKTVREILEAAIEMFR